MDNKTENITWRRIFTNYNLFYFFMMIMYAAGGNEWMMYLRGYFRNPIAMVLPILLTIIFILKNKINFNNRAFILILSIFAFWTILVIIKYEFHLHVFFIFLQLFIAYSIVCVYKLKIFSLYEHIVTKLTIIGLFVWGLNLLFPTLWDIVCPHFAFSRGGITKYNFFFASVLNTSTQVETWYRNPGFSWEPGMNGCLICLAIFLNLVRTQCQLRKNYNLFILLLGLISSFSTTGYSCLLGGILPFFMANKKRKNAPLFFLILLPLAVFIFQLDFMASKIESLQATDESIYNASMMETERGVYTPQRFDAMAFEWMNIRHDPILGYGLTPDNSYVKTTVSEYLYLPGGLLKLYSNYGLLLGGLLSFFMIYSTIRLSRVWNCKWGGLFFFVYLLVSVSYTFYEIPLFIAFYFIGFWLNPKKIVEDR